MDSGFRVGNTLHLSLARNQLFKNIPGAGHVVVVPEAGRQQARYSTAVDTTTRRHTS